MFNDPGFTLADQMFWIVDLFCKTMAQEACKRRVTWVSVPLWTRVRTLRGRFCALYALWKAGTLPKARMRTSSRPSSRSGSGAPTDGVRARPASLLPRRFLWMYRMLPLSAGTLGCSLGALLDNHPEMKVFVAECPRVGRVLRPLCRMAGLKAPEWLALPRRKRGSSPRPSPRGGEGDARGRRRTAREVARAAIERSERTGKPVDPRRIGAVAYGYVLHWPRDDNCPPPEIGYGGRSFPPLPKDYVRPDDGEG